MTRRTHVELVKEGDYVAEVDVELLDDDGPDGWGPYLSAGDALKLDDVRQSLRRGNVVEATRNARVYRLVPVPAA
mgnify:CR=1 FL=1